MSADLWVNLWAILWVGLWASRPAAAFEPVIEPLSGGQIDWTRLELVAEASGRPPGGSMLSWEAMEGEARSLLGPKMLRLARDVRVDATRYARDLLEGVGRVADRLDDNLSLWESFEIRYHTSGLVEVEGALPLHAWLRPALVARAKGRDRGGPAVGAQTGLLIDMRGLGAIPAVAPVLRAESGEVIYALDGLVAPAVALRMPVVYVTDPADPVAVARAGESPVLARAIRVDNGVDPVVSAADAARILAAAASSPFLLQAQVVMVIESHGEVDK